MDDMADWAANAAWSPYTQDPPYQLLDAWNYYQLAKADNPNATISFTGHSLAGLKKGQGEMALYKVERRDGNLYMIFKSWRGKSYDARTARGSELPASEKELSEYLDVLKRSTLVKKPPR